MSTAAMGMMILALITLWGGLVMSILHLRKHPDDPD
ncbi:MULTISPECIES: methionine/alanine import family NSS transporter small subunit [Rhodococcus]|nr:MULTISPECIES: methionine/alanine import family NSS transporter small subunit [Rhodococcus]